MSRLEIIHLRLSGRVLTELARQIHESVRAVAESSDRVAIYRRDGLETDVAIHIHRRGESEGAGPSALGLHLAAALREHGMVEHTLWDELR